jgi:hypothetical protein
VQFHCNCVEIVESFACFARRRRGSVAVFSSLYKHRPSSTSKLEDHLFEVVDRHGIAGAAGALDEDGLALALRVMGVHDPQERRRVRDGRVGAEDFGEILVQPASTLKVRGARLDGCF